MIPGRPFPGRTGMYSLRLTLCLRFNGHFPGEPGLAGVCQSTEGKNITFRGLVYPKLTWGLSTLSLTTSSSWLPCGRVAMPLISPLMPVPQYW